MAMQAAELEALLLLGAEHAAPGLLVIQSHQTGQGEIGGVLARVRAYRFPTAAHELMGEGNEHGVRHCRVHMPDEARAPQAPCRIRR